MTKDCFRYNTNMEYLKTLNLLDTTTDNVPEFVTKN